MASIISKVSRSLKGINFPADRRKVVEQARRNSAPGDVMDALNHIPDKNYESMAGVWQAVGHQK